MHNIVLNNATQRAMLFLTYIQGPDINEWVLAMARWVATQRQNGFHSSDERIWQVVEDTFQRRFYNNLKKEQAQAILRAGIKMTDGDVDSYINKFECLVQQSGYRINEPLTLEIFTRGLPRGLFEKVYKYNNPTTYTQWKDVVIHCQQQIYPHEGSIGKVQTKDDATAAVSPTNRLDAMKFRSKCDGYVSRTNKGTGGWVRRSATTRYTKGVTNSIHTTRRVYAEAESS